MKSKSSVQKTAFEHTSVLIFRPPTELKPRPGNPRIHSEKQLFKLKRSIEQFGFTTAVLVDEDSFILCGHGRAQAAVEMALATIPTRIIAGLTEAEKRAYVIADNKLSQLSSWDAGLLKAEMELLIDAEIGIESTAFSTAEVDVMFDSPAGSTKNDPDDLHPTELGKSIVSRTGDLWKLGNQRLLCANSLESTSYEELLQGKPVQMVFTDVPYNVPITGHVSGNGKVQHKEFAMASGEMSPAQFVDFLSHAFRHIKKFSQNGAVIYICMDWRHTRELQDAAQPLFGPARQMCVWTKDNGGMGTFYRSQHELVYVYRNGDAPHINNFELGQYGRYRTNVWAYPGVNTFKGKGHELLALHPTVKPVSLVADAIRDCSHRKGIVLDPFAGSGTILIAAERTGRHARAIEIDPTYVDVAMSRWQRVTGRQAILASTGQTWEQLRTERLAVPPTGGNHDL